MTLSGPNEDQVLEPRRRGPGKRSLPGRGDKTPARGACRDDQAEAPRPRREELAGKANQGTPREARRGAPRAPARPGERQALRRGKRAAAAASHHLRPALQLTYPRVAL